MHRLSVIRIANRFEIDGLLILSVVVVVVVVATGGLADSRRQRVRYYRQARSSERPERAGPAAWKQRRRQRPSRRCHAGRRRPHLPLSHERFAQRSAADALRRSKGIMALRFADNNGLSIRTKMITFCGTWRNR